MFHDVEFGSNDSGRIQFPMPGSQATKVIRFINEQKQRCRILICQCEYGVSIAPAIANAVGLWLGVPVTNLGIIGAVNRHVQTMIEMAIDFEIISESLLPISRNELDSLD